MEKITNCDNTIASESFMKTKYKTKRRFNTTIESVTVWYLTGLTMRRGKLERKNICEMDFLS